MKDKDFYSLLLLGLWLYSIISTCFYGTYNEVLFWYWAIFGTAVGISRMFGNFLGLPGMRATDEEKEMFRQADREGKILWFYKLTVPAFLAAFGWVGVVLHDKFSLEVGPISLAITVCMAFALCATSRVIGKRQKNVD